MKTITVKLPEEEAKRLDQFIKKKDYPSKSEFVRHLIREKMEDAIKEKQGWLAIAEQSMKKVWDNKKDDETWSTYI